MHKVAYAPERDEFTVRVDKEPRVVFKNSNGSYLATASEFDAPTRQVCITRVEALDDDELPALVDSDSDSDDESDHGVAPRTEVAMPFKAIEVPTVETTKANEMMFSKRQVRDAQVAKELMRRLGYASVKDEALLVNSGAILNCPVTTTNVYRAVKIYGSDVASLKGKTKQQPSKIVKIEHVPRNMVTT